MLTLEVSVEADEQYHDRDADKGSAERLAEMLQVLVGFGGQAAVGDGCVEPKELGDGNTYGCKGQRCSKPGQESALYETGCQLWISAEARMMTRGIPSAK